VATFEQLAAEVSRVLAPGGTFITQQVDVHSYETPGAWPVTVRQRRFLVAAVKPPG